MSRKPTFTQDIDLPTLITEFGSEEKCIRYLEALRWPNGVACPRCESRKISRIVKRNQFDCDACRYQFSVRVGTIFSDSHLPLWKWFLAVYVVGESKKGVSANQLKRMLGVSYKTAWYLCHRIRAAMIDETGELLDGTVEVDETWMGHGPRKGYQSRPAQSPLTTVMGAVERGEGGQVSVRISDHKHVSRADVKAFLAQAVSTDATLYSDSAEVYDGIADGRVNHSIGQWVQADVHTNTIEGVWSLFKRSLVGSYHHLSVKHLDAYLDEMAFRYNNRENAHLFRDTLLALIGADSLPYAELIAEAS